MNSSFIEFSMIFNAEAIITHSGRIWLLFFVNFYTKKAPLFYKQDFFAQKDEKSHYFVMTYV